jgi:hypothetical protein
VDGLRGVAAGLLEVALEGGGEHAAIELRIQAGADADQDPAAHALECGHEEKRSDDEHGEHHQRGFVARAEHAVIHLQHVERRGEHHQVDEAAEGAYRGEGVAQGAQRLAELVDGRFASGLGGHRVCCYRARWLGRPKPCRARGRPASGRNARTGTAGRNPRPFQCVRSMLAQAIRAQA